MIFSDISDHSPIFAQVMELGDFSGNDDSFVTIKCRLKNSERYLMFRSLIEHIQYEVHCRIDNDEMLCGTFISCVTSAYDSFLKGKKYLIFVSHVWFCSSRQWLKKNKG